jgi:isoquinoline 1-oxidoreductase alpha subunit
MINLTINGKSHSVDVEPDTPLLWVIRDTLGMTGTKYGCGIARSCGMTVGDAAGKKITTIEGLAENGVLTTACLPKCSRPGSPTTCRNAATARVA